MKIFIHSIPEEGIHLQDKIPSDFIAKMEDGSFEFLGPLSLDAKIDRAEDTVLARIQARGLYQSFCARCLEKIENQWRKKIELDFAIDKNTEFIEMDEDIRQEIILSLPVRILCSNDCQGLCPSCGINLNKTKCQCAIQTQQDAKTVVK